MTCQGRFITDAPVRMSADEPDFHLRWSRRKLTVRRVYTCLAALLLIVDTIGGVTSTWEDELSRVQTSRVRLLLDVVACCSSTVIELRCLSKSLSLQRANFLLLPVTCVLLTLTTAGGVVVSLVAHMQSWAQPHDHEWIFGVESAGVLLLLLFILAGHATSDCMVLRALHESQPVAATE